MIVRSRSSGQDNARIMAKTSIWTCLALSVVHLEAGSRPHRRSDSGTAAPPDVRPTRYALQIGDRPGPARFHGTADISVTLDKRREVIWLHGAS